MENQFKSTYSKITALSMQCMLFGHFRYQACAQDFSIRAPHGGVPPGDAHGGS